jgi:excisionase family DNA binding protein
VSEHRSVASLIVAALDEATLDSLAARLTPRIAERLGQGDDSWLSTREAASYLGLSVDAPHNLTAARSIPFEQDAPGCKLWFQRSELDRWRRGGGSITKPSASTPLPRTRKAAS